MDKIGLLLDYASKGDVDAVKMLLDENMATLTVDSPDYDGRTAMHLAASEGHYNVIEFLMKNNAHVNPVDRWRKTPLADARWYANLNANSNANLDEKKLDKQIREDKLLAYAKVCDHLLKHGGSTSSPFEIDPAELIWNPKFFKKCQYGEIKLYNWRGTEVSARIMDRKGHSVSPKSESQLIRQLSLLQSCRHPNIVQFLGAVTNFSSKRGTRQETKALALVTEHLPNGNLLELLHQKKWKIPLKDALQYALDIARGMNYLHRHLHQHKPDPIVHGELNPMNLLRDEAGHLKVSGIGLSKLIGCIWVNGTDTAIKNLVYSHCDPRFDFKRYVAPEVQRGNAPDKTADVYSFGVIIHEMLEGRCLASRQAQVVPSKSGKQVFPVRPLLPARLRMLLEECCRTNPMKRPDFKNVIVRLEDVNDTMKRPWWSRPKPMLEYMLNKAYLDCMIRRAKAHSVVHSHGDDSLNQAAKSPARRSRAGKLPAAITDD